MNSTQSQPIWRPICADDLDSVNQIADQIHTGLPERPEVFAEKVSLFPQGCQKLIMNNQMVGYGICHPWNLNSIPPLDAFLKRLPNDFQCLYIHDVVVLPQARGHAASAAYVDYIKQLAKSMSVSFMALVSVYGTDVLWGRYGFSVVKDTKLSKKLTSYGETAKYMTLRL